MDRPSAPQPYLLSRPQLRFVTYLQSERPYSACAVMPGGCGGSGYSAVCGYEDGTIEVLHTPAAGMDEDHEQKLVYRARSHASRVRRRRRRTRHSQPGLGAQQHSDCALMVLLVWLLLLSCRW